MSESVPSTTSSPESPKPLRSSLEAALARMTLTDTPGPVSEVSSSTDNPSSNSVERGSDTPQIPKKDAIPESTYAGFGGQQRMKTNVTDFTRMEQPTLSGLQDTGSGKEQSLFIGNLGDRRGIEREADHLVHGAHDTERRQRILEMYGPGIEDRKTTKTMLDDNRNHLTMSQRYRANSSRRQLGNIRNMPHKGPFKKTRAAIRTLRGK